jgi:hypothetical protein
MRHLIVAVAVAFGLASANPTLVTIINEFSTDTAHQWVELHVNTDEGPGESLNYWNDLLLWTSTSSCTLDFSGDTILYAVIDSQTLARGIYGRGKFRLNPESDYIATSAFDQSEVSYPAESIDYNHAPAPPPGGSASLWFNGIDSRWYIDSSGSPGEPNKHDCEITGTMGLSPDSIGKWYYLIYQVSGPNGACGNWDLDWGGGSYCAGGLPPGRYFLSAHGCELNHGDLSASYPESISLAYGQTVPNINLYLLSSGVPETGGRSPPTAPALDVRGHILALTCPDATFVHLDLYDPTGRRRAILCDGKMPAGRHEFDLAARVSPGAYLARLKAGSFTRTVKVVVLR